MYESRRLLVFIRRRRRGSCGWEIQGAETTSDSCTRPMVRKAKARATACHRVTRQLMTKSLLYQRPSLAAKDWREDPRRRGGLIGRPEVDVEDDDSDLRTGDGLRTV